MNSRESEFNVKSDGGNPYISMEESLEILDVKMEESDKLVARMKDRLLITLIAFNEKDDGSPDISEESIRAMREVIEEIKELQYFARTEDPDPPCPDCGQTQYTVNESGAKVVCGVCGRGYHPVPRDYFGYPIFEDSEQNWVKADPRMM